MALPKSKPDIKHQSDVIEAEKFQEARQVRESSGSGAEPGPLLSASPARRLQSLLEAELHQRRAPSAKRSMTTILVLSLACSVAALSLYSFGWI